MVLRKLRGAGAEPGPQWWFHWKLPAARASDRFSAVWRRPGRIRERWQFRAMRRDYPPPARRSGAVPDSDDLQPARSTSSILRVLPPVAHREKSTGHAVPATGLNE